MAFPLVYVVILLLNMFDFPSGILYNKGEMTRYFACSSEGFPQKDEIFKLYLSSALLEIRCFFQTEDEVTSREILSVFTSGGLAPTLEIINSTYTGIFHFNLTLFSDQVYWVINIPRENITKNTDITAIEEWLVRISLHLGLNIYATEGTLLDTMREPILQWKLGVKMKKSDINRLYPHVIDLKVTKCPCANDVALLGFILNTTYYGIYLGLSFSGFWDYDNTTWYNMTENIYSELEDLIQLSVVDMVLTNHFLVMLTSLGLFVSRDLRHPSASVLQFSRADFCGFERADYVKGKLWYSEKCFANKESFEDDYVTITFDRNKTLSEASACFYSSEPFLEWFPCIPQTSRGVKNIPSKVITFLIDIERGNGVYLLSNQVWLSVDGGNTFELIADLHGDSIKTSYHSFYTSDIAFVSQYGNVYLTKAGLKKYSKIGSITDNIFTLYYDHLGFVHKLTPNWFEADRSSSATGSSKAIFTKTSDMGFETALAPQYISLNEMIIFAYVPSNEPEATKHTKRFSNIHFGKMLHSRKTGIAYIKKVLQLKSRLGFLSSVIADIIEPFGVESLNESSCLSSSLYITMTGNYIYRLILLSPGVNAFFQNSDLQKTVMIPGYSSFLILKIVNTKNAFAIATMPERAPVNRIFPRDSWFLYNFGITTGRIWSIFSKKCSYWIQRNDDESLSLNSLRYSDLGKYYSFNVKIIPTMRDFLTLDVPLVTVLVGNLNSLDIRADGFFDNTNSYHLNISLCTKFLRAGSTSLAFIVWDASTECFVTTFMLIVKSSCSYLRLMHYIPSKLISLEDWTRGIHKDSQDFNLIKTLPINYRPPSTMGIAIPLTDNFYHADPSKPIPRNLFLKSKSTGKFKQCANASTREECNCTNDQKLSYAVAFSDCREKVPRFKFPVTQYPISLEISTRNGQIPVDLPYLVTVTEVNMRENWKLKQHTPATITKLQSHLKSYLKVPVYNPKGLNLSIRGSELFHFKISVVPGVTFCNLVEEFQIYVDEAPLPFPGHTLIAIAAAIMLGGLIFIVFMFKLHNIHPWDLCKTLLRRNKMNFSNTVVFQQAHR
ncbi:cation channel sperm-associated protein subunit beta [Orycteropus afer afer]|uniref:Cation channel sperm-associated protein subunit beta n=1 Tax=Orycteropus afer afer TaxID=1230840 RepID=A0A8B7A9H1_ORYAF|nr:cation channel sperm-associated protein subunit beta [Orycteropus afer afer]